jgi:hypothetical protein
LENDKLKFRNKLQARLNKPLLQYTPLHASAIGPLTQPAMQDSLEAMNVLKNTNKQLKSEGYIIDNLMEDHKRAEDEWWDLQMTPDEDSINNNSNTNNNNNNNK